MTQVMNRPGFGLTAPTSRQDVISALLNEYGTSFGQHDESAYAFPTVSALKELPPPPPSSYEKSLPSGMSMRFQLRVDDNAPPDDRRKNSIESPTKIAYRAISRSSKPPSLKLLSSNGSTALIPPTSAPPAPAKDNIASTSQSLEERPLPPPPPEKSIRRKSVRPSQADLKMGHEHSKIGRRDSKEPQEPQESDSGSNHQQQTETAPSPKATKRKPLPSITKKFASLADLKNGPRGGSAKGKPAASSAEMDTSSTRSSSQETIRPSTQVRKAALPRSSVESSQTATMGHQQTPTSKSSVPSALPPAPIDMPSTQQASVPPPPRKVYGGLPSNPRAKDQNLSATTSMKHSRGKSSTSFEVMKTSNQASIIASSDPNTTTSGPTLPPMQPEGSAQAPTLAEAIQGALRDPQTPLTPFSEHNDRRPFSFEKQNQHQQEPAAASVPAVPTPASSALPVSPIAAAPVTQYPPRTTSRPEASQPTQTQGAAPRGLPIAQSFQGDVSFFVPLTRAPIDIAPQPITPKQFNCYTNHAQFTEYLSRFQRTGCMVCGKSERGARCTCTWCLLQICVGCRDDLRRTRGRNLQILLDQKHQQREAENARRGRQSGGTAPANEG